MNVCRLCLDYTHTTIEDLMLHNPLYHMQIKLLLPEIDIDLTPTYGLCLQCSNSLETSYTFRNKCIQTEAFINERLKNCETSTIDLNSLKHPSIECVFLLHSNSGSTVNYDQVESGVGDNWQEEVDNSEEVINHSHKVENESEANFNETDTITPILTCNHCHLVFQDEEIFQKHSEICNTVSECKTEEPFVNIGKNENLKSPSDNNQISLGQFKCTTKSSYNAIKNLKSVDGKNGQHAKEEYFCKKCKIEFPTMYRLQIHLDSHSRKQTFVCSVCDRHFTRKRALQWHEEIHKGNNHKCSICLKNYPSKHSLNNHVKNTHTKTHICELCGRRCGRKATLIAHMRTHTGERPYRCEMCGKGFTQRGTLMIHIKCIHSEERPFQCAICQNTFNYKGALRKHMTTHMDHNVKNFICSVGNCGKRFYAKYLLQSHVLRHKYRELLKYKCTICERAFESLEKLKRHTRCHTGEKPFKCPLCEKAFNQKSNVKIHMKSHRSKENRGTKGGTAS